MVKQPMEQSERAQPKGLLFCPDVPKATNIVFPVSFLGQTALVSSIVAVIAFYRCMLIYLSAWKRMCRMLFCANQKHESLSST
jgi:hypothetical protein